MEGERKGGIAVKALCPPAQPGAPLQARIEASVRVNLLTTDEVLFLCAGIVGTVVRLARDFGKHSADTQRVPAEAMRRFRQVFQRAVAGWIEDDLDVSMNGFIRSRDFPQGPQAPQRKPPKDDAEGWGPDQEGQSP